MKKNKKKILLIILILFPIFIASVSATWIILSKTVFAPRYNPAGNSILYNAFNNQNVDYSGVEQGPTSINSSVDNADVSFSYREAGSISSYINGLPKNAGEYDILVKDKNDVYVDDVVRFTINKIAPTLTPPTLDKDTIYEGEAVGYSGGSATGLGGKPVSGSFSYTNSAGTAGLVYTGVADTCSSKVRFTFFPSGLDKQNYLETEVEVNVTMLPVAYISSSYYGTIEAALSSAVSGNIVCIIPPKLANYNNQTNAVNPDKITYYIRNNCTIKEGVTLFIPTDSASASSVTDSSSLTTYIGNMKKSSRNQGNSGYDSYAEKNENRFLRITIEVAKEKTITNNGTLLISGYLSGGTSNSGCVGQTSHSYSRIVLNEGASILQTNSNAETYCFGFINEKTENNNSMIYFQQGKLYLPCIINDYRGFTYSYAMTNDAINTNRCSAFNEMEFRNIDVLSKINYTASVYGIINIYVLYDTLSVNETMTIEKGVVGTTNDFLIKQTDSNYSYITYKYTPSNNTFKTKCYGGFYFNYLSIDLSMKGQSITLSTQNAYFPISYKFDVELLCAANQNSATFNISSQRMKIMTGGKVYVGDNVTLSGDEIVVYSAFLDGSYGNGQGVNSPSRPIYPVKDNGYFEVSSSAIVSLNKCAGNIFCDNPSNISATTTSIISKEPWTIGTSGSLTVPWTVNNYLELREELSIVSTDNIVKNKICAGVNTFTNTNAYKPSYSLHINDGEVTETINTAQKVIFLDSISNYSVELISNIYTVYNNRNIYTMNSIITYNDTRKYICATNSELTISNNNSGVNEFEVQSITITGSSHNLDLDTVIQLNGTIDDIQKSYSKKYTWSSLDTSIATVDQTGQVKGISIGTTTIQLSCGGVSGEYEINVIEPVSNIEAISTVTISEFTGKADGATFKDGSYTFNASLIGENGSSLKLDDVSKVEWSFRNLSSVVGERVYFGTDSNNKLTTESGTLSVKVTLKGGFNANSSLGAADEVYVVCKVTDKKGNIKSKEFHIINDNASTNPCITEGTLITMADGTQKKVEDIKVGDYVKVFNHETGKIDTSFIAINVHDNDEQVKATIMNLMFDNGQISRISFEHGFFDVDLNEYVYINMENYLSMIGHRFYTIDGSIITLTDVYITEEYVRVFSPVTYKHLNIFSDNLLSVGGDLRGLINIFELDDEMKIDIDKMNVDIEKYGLYTYDEWSEYLTLEQFDAFNVKYLKVSIGKGLVTKEEIMRYIYSYL